MESQPDRESQLRQSMAEAKDSGGGQNYLSLMVQFVREFSDPTVFEEFVAECEKVWLPEAEALNLIASRLVEAYRSGTQSALMSALLDRVDTLLKRKKAVEIGKRKLAQFENIHRGERCVIIGNGPSLNRMDLSFLKNEFTFGLNRIYLGFEKFDFHPTYHVCVNPAVLQQSGREMLERVHCPKFLAFEAIPTLDPEDDAIFINTRRTLNYFNTDARHGVSLGSTVTFGAMQLAYFMGFETVILIGVDHYFETKGKPHLLVESLGDDPNHFHPKYFGKGYQWQLPDLENSEVSYRLARRAFEDVGRRIIDASLDGRCYVFPKGDYRSIFKIEGEFSEAGQFVRNASPEHGQELLINWLSERNLSGNQAKTLIEIGSTRENLPGQGSTEKLARLCKSHGMHFVTVDMNPLLIERAVELLAGIDSGFLAICAKGEEYLSSCSREIDFVFLDAYDYDHGYHSQERQAAYERHLGKRINNEDCHLMHLECAKALLDKLSDAGLICFDDTWKTGGAWQGKGTLAVPYLLENGFLIVGTGYRSVLLSRDQEKLGKSP